MNFDDKLAPKPQVGERWQVIYQGEVCYDGLQDNGWLKLRCMVDGGTLTLHPKIGGTWERLPDPEPEFTDGEVYRRVTGEWVRLVEQA